MAITLTICESANIAVNPVVPATVTINPNLPGVAATVAVGTTTTGAPGTDAEVVNSGTSLHAIFDFTIPRGEAGTPGEPGPAGVMYATAPLSLNTGTHTLSIDLSAYATQSFVTSQGYITASALTGYATRAWVDEQGFLLPSDLNGYATQSWVNTRGFLTSADLSGYATESFVTSQGYITSSALAGYATESYVTSAVAAKVSKTGDTMTGELTIDYGSTVGRTDINGGVIAINGAGDYFGYGVNLDGLNGIVTASTPSSGYMTMNPATGLRFADGTTQSTAGISSSTASSTYAPIAAAVPTGGTTGQALVKSSNSNYATTWTTIQTGDKYLTTSTTSLLIGNGAKTLTVATGLAYTTQQDIVIAYDATHHMHAVVTSYNSTTGALVADVQNHTGAGTFASWTVNVGGTTTAVLPVGGTTGQILQKASNADFDVSWTTNSATVAWGGITGTLSSQTDLNTALGLKAPLASPTFTGTVTIPAGASISGYLTTATAASTYQTQAGMSSYALLASPTFTGTPVAPTAATVTNSTQIATTAFVKNQSYLTTSTASSTYAPIASPTLTGTPAAPTAATATNTTQIATTAFVKNQGYATLASPTFTGTVTIPAGASISGYLTTSTASTTYAPLASPTFTGTVTIPAGASISGYLTSATAASTYQTQAGMSSYLTTAAASTTYQTQAGMSAYLTTSAAASTYYPQTNPSGYITSSALTGYATQSWVTSQGYLTSSALTGYATESWVTGQGYITSSALTGYATESWVGSQGYQTASDVSTYVTGLGYLTDAPSDGSIYGRKDGAWEAVAGGTAAADQLTAGVVTANPTSGPTTAGDVLQYNGTDLVWAASGSSFNGGAISNPITIAGATIDSEMSSDFFGVELTADPTKGSVLYYTGLDTYDGSSHMLVGPTGLTFPDLTTQTPAGIGDAPSGGVQYARKDGAWEVVAPIYPSFNDVSSFYPYGGGYTLQASDRGNVVFNSYSSAAIVVPNDATYNFPVGTIIYIAFNTYTQLQPTDYSGPTINGSSSNYYFTATNGVFPLIKIGSNAWVVNG